MMELDIKWINGKVNVAFTLFEMRGFESKNIDEIDSKRFKVFFSEMLIVRRYNTGYPVTLKKLNVNSKFNITT